MTRKDVFLIFLPKKVEEFMNFLEILIEFEENRFGTTEQFDAIQWKNIERCQKCQEFW